VHAQGLRLRQVLRWLAYTAIRGIVFRYFRLRRHTGNPDFAAQWLACTSPVNASSTTLRLHTHDSGPGWVANPSLYSSFIYYSLPALIGAPKVQLGKHVPNSLSRDFFRFIGEREGERNLGKINIF